MAAPSLTHHAGRPVAWPVRFYRSTIGRKVVMALTGIVLVGFLIVHMSGNLLIHRGAHAINDYAAFLKSNVALLWGTRAVLLVAAALHIHSALTLTARARAARPTGYLVTTRQVSTAAARLMRLGGVILAVFIVIHLLHFTAGTVLPSLFVEGEVYQNVVRSFRLWWVSAFYLVAMVALGFHLHHGVASLFQTLGANHPNLEGTRAGLARVLAVLLTVGFVSVPIAVVLGWVR